MPPFRRRLSLLGYSHIRPTPQGENHSLCFLYHASLFLCCLDFWVCPSLSVQPNRKPTDKNRKSLAKNRPNGKRPKRRRQIAYSSRGRNRCGFGVRTTIAVTYSARSSRGSTTARLKAACDNRFKLSLNGRVVANGDDWGKPVELDVQTYLKPGKNVLEADVDNDGGPAGFVMKLVLSKPGEKSRYVVSDNSWKATERSNNAEAVPVCKIAKLGDAPWGDVFSAPDVNAPSTSFRLLPGFQVERLFTVPRAELGSWVCIAFDNKGRLIASDEGNKGLCRITLPPLGSNQEVKVEHLNVKMRERRDCVGFR